MSSRRVYKLPEVAFFQEGPGLRTHQWTNEGMKVINVTNILQDGSVDTSNTDKFVSLTEFEGRYPHFAIEEKDIVVASSGNTYGKVGRIRQEHLPLMMKTSVIRFHSANQDILDGDYLFSFLRSPAFQTQVEAFVIGGAQPNFGPSHLKQMTIALPSLKEQRLIASILSAYDDLIENNRRRIALLEESARQLYQEWFVRLRFPGHEHTRIIDGVPEGWERRPLERCAQFLSGGTPSKGSAAYWGGEIPWISSGEMTELRLQDSTLRLTDEGVEQGSRLVPINTILAVVRGMSLAKEFRIAITSKPVAFNQDLKALRCEPDLRPEYLFAALVAQRDQIRDRATEASHGTKKLDTPVLAAVPILVPSERLQEEYCDIIVPMNKLWDNCWIQNQRLRAARDLLLPRLMSGEAEV